MHRIYVILSCFCLLFTGGVVAAQQQSQPITSGTEAGSPGGVSQSTETNGVASSENVAGEEHVALPKYFYKRLTGTIDGRYHIVVNLTRMGSVLLGDYYYRDQGIPLFFGYGSTISNEGTVHLIETNELQSVGPSDVTGAFDGKFVGKNELRGTWTKADSSKPLPFAVTTVGLSEGSFDMEHRERSYDDRSHGSAKIDITYPVLRTDSSETDAALNANIVSTVIGQYESGVDSVPPTTVSQAMQDFIDSFTAQLTHPSTRTYFPPWSYSITAHILFNSDGILSMRYESFSFEGGAHPNTIYENASYDSTTGSIITLDDLLMPGSADKLNAIGLKEFRRERGIPAGESLQKAGYFVSGANFKLNTNFMITKAGLLFQFNQYEIAPYYFGAQQVLIPYPDLKGLLLPNSPVAALAASSAGGIRQSLP